MKSNKPIPETYTNRVAQFNKTEQRLPNVPVKGKEPGSTLTDTTKENPYMIARLKVLNDYKEGRRIEVLAMERDNRIDHRHYEEFVTDVLRVAGDIPSLAIRNRIKGI
jgi:hypothetical protein